MMRRGFIGLLVAGGALAIGACGALFPSWTYRYRLTVEVVDNGRVYSGSSVIQIKRERTTNGVGGIVTGEAVAVDIGDKGTLFALLDSDVWAAGSRTTLSPTGWGRKV